MTAKELFEKLVKEGNLPIHLNEDDPTYIQTGIIMVDEDDFIIDDMQCYPPHFTKKEIMKILEEDCDEISEVIEMYEKAM